MPRPDTAVGPRAERPAAAEELPAAAPDRPGDEPDAPDVDLDAPPLRVVVAMFQGECFAISDRCAFGIPLVAVGPAFETLTGYTPAEAVHRNLGFLQHADTDQEGTRLLREAYRLGEPCTVVLRSYRRDGSLFWCEQQHFPVADELGEPRWYVTLLRDVTERTNLSLARDAARRIGQHFGDHAGGYEYSLVVEGHSTLRLAWISEGVAQLAGASAAEVRASGLLARIHPDDRKRVERRAFRFADAARHGTVSAGGRPGHASALDTAPQRERYRLLGPDGDALWVEDTTAVSWTASGGQQVALHGRVDRLPAAPAAQPQVEAQIDPLTGLPDVSIFHDRVQQAMYRARRSGEHVAVAHIDLERFGFVNETFGRATGDRLLQAVAARLRRALRMTDTLARLGSDTFAVLLPGLPAADDALPVLEKLVAAIGAPLGVRGAVGVAPPASSDADLAPPARTPERTPGPGEIRWSVADPAGGATLQLSAMVGVALFPYERVRVAGELIDFAEAALATAKARGDRFSFHHEGLDRRMRDRIRVRGELRRALERDELVLHYQPRVSLRTGRVTSVEALVRWLHPERGLLKPDDFLPDAESSQLGGALFEWVLERGCAQAKRWQGRGAPRRVAVNVSGQALERADFLALVTDAIARHDLHPSLLEIELTEGTAMDVLVAASDTLTRLRATGVHVALDDFGVAYASLSQLKTLPLDSLKIDRSFVSAIRQDEPVDHLALLSAIIAIGKSLNLTIVAEGVETLAQQRLLRRLRCDEVQGFLHSQAVPPEFLRLPHQRP